MLSNSETGRLISQYGYLAVLAGTMLEGETVVLVAGFLAHQGYLSLFWIMVFAVIGSTVSDQGLFFLSRFKGMAFLARFPKLRSKVRGMACRMHSRPVALAAFALFFRFLYGLRNIAPVFLGMSDISTARFVILNGIGAVLWAVLFSSAGYIFGKAVVAAMGGMAKLEMIAIGIIIGVSLSFFMLRRWKQAREATAEPESQRKPDDKEKSKAC